MVGHSETTRVPACPTCGKPFGPEIRFCPEDGTPLTDTAIGAATATPTARGVPTVPLPTLIGERYRIFELRGGGGMAQVFRAIDTTLEREVAVKLINPGLRTDPEFDARFQREARIASQLADPHIVVVHDFGFDQNHGPYLVMEYLKGQSLRERLRFEGRLPYPAALQLGAQMLLALVHAHEKGVVHRDIKPDNVFLLNQSGVRLLVRILDFGIARIYRDDAPIESPTITQPGAVIGTPRYMAPEQLAGDVADARTDLYSAAVVLFEAMTGQVPYTGGKSLMDLCPEADPELQELLESCLRPDRNLRPRSAAEAYLKLHDLGKASGALVVSSETLEQISAPQGIASLGGSNTVTYVPKGVGHWTRRRWIFSAGALLLALGTILGIVYGRRSLPTGGESLAGVRLGENRDAVVARLGNPSHPVGDPWKTCPNLFGSLLRTEDLGPAEAARPLELLTWDNHHLGVLLSGNQVCAVIVRSPRSAQTARGVRIDDNESRLLKSYEEPSDVDKEHFEDDDAGGRKKSAWGILYRYASLGLNAVVRDKKINGLALYPPK
jgi:serine/threonine protein kinase